LSVVDYGDLPVVPGYVEESHGRSAAGLLEVVQAGVIPIDLGGDHSIALPELRALAKVHGKVGLIQLDSHSDTSEEYFGQPHTHGTPFYHAVKEGLVEPSRSIQVGLRGPVYSDRDYAIPREMGMEVITGVEAPTPRPVCRRTSCTSVSRSAPEPGERPARRQDRRRHWRHEWHRGGHGSPVRQ